LGCEAKIGIAPRACRAGYEIEPAERHFAQSRVLEEKPYAGRPAGKKKINRRGFAMKKWIAPAALLLPLALAGCSHPQPVYVAPEPPPPAVFSAIAQQAFHDGYDAGRRDIQAGRSFDLNRHPRFRNPPVAPEAAEDYRHGFREGYSAAFHGAPPPPGY
jgi:hypothetical protein